MKNKFKICCLSAVLVTTALYGSYFIKSNFVFNTTKSLPQYVFYKEDLARKFTLQHGDYVSVCPFYSKMAEFYKLKEHFENGDCNNGVVPLIKKVAAIPGDVISVNDKNGMTVNERTIKNTKALSSKIQHFKFAGIVPKGHYLLYTPHPEGFDSRYLGLITDNEIIYKLKPIF